MSSSLQIPVLSASGDPLPGITIRLVRVSYPVVTKFMEWWTGQFARIRNQALLDFPHWYVVVNSEWSAEQIMADDRIGPPPRSLLIEVWGDTIATPVPPNFEVLNPTNGKARYLAKQPPKLAQEMMLTNGHWRVDYNLHFFTFPYGQTPPDWIVKSDPEPTL